MVYERDVFLVARRRKDPRYESLVGREILMRYSRAGLHSLRTIIHSSAELHGLESMNNYMHSHKMNSHENVL